MVTKDLGLVTAYAYAVSKGYTGTEEEFAELMASYASIAQDAANAALASAQSAQSAQTAAQSAQSAQTAAEGAKDTAQATVSGAIAGIQAEGQTQIGAVQSEGTSQVGNVNSAGQTQVGNVNAAGATQVGNVNTAGSTQVSAIQAKGNQIIASLPEDYTEIRGQVGQLSDEIDDIGSDVTDLKSALTLGFGQVLEQTIPTPSSGNAIATIAFRVFKNQPYLLTISNTTAGITISTRETNMGSNLETLYTGPATSIVVVPNYDANYVRFVSSKGADLSFVTLTPKMNYESIQTMDGYITAIEAVLPTHIKTQPNLVTDYGFNINAINTNLLLRLNFALNSTNIPANLPFAKWESERVALLLTSVKTEGTLSAGDAQILFTSKAGYLRNYVAAWNDWIKLYDNSSSITHEYTVDVNGTGDYTSLCACIDAAVAYENSVIRVKRGTYDAISEMLALKGDNYFADFTTNTEQIYVRNGVKVICEPGTVMTAHYTGTNATVKSYYSPINFSNSDGYVEGLEIDASNCRYCIHDDQWTKTEPYKHELKNCRLIIDNSGNTDWNRRLAFGGGLGVNGYIIFSGCYFKSVGLDGTAYSGYGSAGYHNSPSADAQSTIYVNNCYFADNSTFRLTRHGRSTKITRAFVSGCSFGREMELTYEQTSSTPINCEIIDCNNIIRS